MPPEDLDLVLDVNLKGVINGVNAALPLLRETPGARIVNTSSVAGIYGTPSLTVYSATKCAVRGLSEALDLEFHRLGVSVCCLMPFFIDTPILDVGTDPDSNRRARDALIEGKTAIYPVKLAAEAAWTAAHGNKVHYTVGKEADRAHFAARFMPNALRAQLRAIMTQFSKT